MSTLSVTLTGIAPATLTLELGTPGPQGSTGPAGPTGATGSQGIPGVGVPAGGASGQFLQKTSGVSYETDWVTVNLAAYAVKANNLSDLTNFATARTNLGLGTMATATAADYSTTTVANGLYAPIAAGLPTGGTVGQVLTKQSGANWDDSWQTLIPGDRYLTSSTTSLTINNANKTLTVGTGLSYTPTQNITISYNAANHMHGEVLTYDSGTGVLTVDINNHTGSGTYASWVVNVGGVTPATSVAWGAITGTLGSQTDLATALNAKLEVSTAASTYQTISGMSSYLTTAAAASTYYPLTGNPSGFLTSAPVTSVAGRTGAITLSNTDISGLGTMSTATATDYLAKSGNLAGLTNTGTARTNLALGTIATVNDAPSDGSTYGRNNGAWVVAGGGGGTAWGSITGTLSSQTDLNTALGTKANLAGAQFTGKVGMGVAPDATAALKVDTNGIKFGDGTTQTTAGYSANGPISYNDGFNTFFLGVNSSIPLTGVGVNGNAVTPTGFVIAAYSGGTITFSDGTTQSTAPTGISAPSSSNAIWYGGAWYSANVSSVYDNNSMSYVNVLSF